MSITNIKLKTDVISQITTELHKTDKVKEMKEKLNDFELYEIDGETYSLNEIRGFIESSKKVERQTRFINALKLNLSETTKERNQLVEKIHFLEAKCKAYHQEVLEITSMGMFEFADNYCNDEQLDEAGKAFAKALLGGK